MGAITAGRGRRLFAKNHRSLTTSEATVDCERSMRSSTAAFAREHMGNATGVFSWNSLFEAEFKPICRFVGRLGVDPSDVEDVAQQVFFVAHRRMREIPKVDNPAAWLRGITIRVSREYFRWRKVRRLGSTVIRVLNDFAHVPAPTPEGALSAAHVTALVRLELQALSPKLREIIVLCEFEQNEPAEVAQILNIPVNTVRSRRALARQELRQRLERKLGGQAMAALEAREWPAIRTV